MTVTDVGAPPVPTVPGDPITDQVMLWFCPGGDIADLHRGRDACTALAQAAATARPALRSTHDRARERWTGNAAEQFSTDIAQVDAWLGRCEAACDNAAQTLDRQATIKEQQLHEAHMHMIHGAVDVLAAAGTGGGWLVRRAAAAATEQAAASLVEVMAPVTKEAADLLTAQAVAAADAAEAAAMQGAPALSRAMHYMGNQMPEWAQSILSGHAISAFGRLVDKVLGGASSPIAAFSMESWGGIDLANVEAGGFLTPVFTGIPKALGIDGLGGWQAVAAQQVSGGVFNGGLTAYGSFVINGQPLDDRDAWWGILLSTLSGVGGGTVGGGLQARNAAKAAQAAAAGLPLAAAARWGGLSSAEWARTVATLPGDYFIARGTRSPSNPEPLPLSATGLGFPSPAAAPSLQPGGPAGTLTADPQAMEEGSHRMGVIGADLTAAGQRFTVDSPLQYHQFGTTKGDMELGVQYGQLRDAVDSGLRRLTESLDTKGAGLQMCARSFDACDRINAAGLQPSPVTPVAPSPQVVAGLEFAREQVARQEAARLAAHAVPGPP